MAKSIDDGISINSRRERAVQGATKLDGFHVGMVMDDQDDQRMGRLWVHIPSLGGKRFDVHSVPSWGGTTPDRQDPSGLVYDQKLRYNWFLVSPMMPFFGSDDYRNQSGPDRNSMAGDVNSYGMWVQPRIGDFVGVLFAGGDAAAGYWIGMLPKPYRNGMVPGVPGEPANAISDRDKSGVPEVVNPQSVLPTMDRVPSKQETESAAEDKLSSSDLARNIAVSGVAGDRSRGAGTSGARRESPSYVTGLKSQGWTYESEKKNRDVSGDFFEKRTELSRVNTVGHSIVMDDHPDYQSMRFRTSAGSQILLNDACECPYVYIQTPKGNVWLELCDGGDINVFAAGSISMHAESDFNLTVDKNYNVQVNGDYNMAVGGNYNQTINGNTAVLRNGSEARTNNGDLDHTVIGASRYMLSGGLDTNVIGTMRSSITNAMDISIGGTTRISSGNKIHLNSGGSMNLDGATINLNGGNISLPESAEDAVPPQFSKPGKASGKPTTDEILKNKRPKDSDYLAAVVPQHQPWPGRCGVGTTAGTNGNVSAGPTGQQAPRSDNLTCERGNINDNVRRGASRADADHADHAHGPHENHSDNPRLQGVHPDVVSRYDKLSELIGERLPINSGYRDPERNKNAKGAKNSQHLHGNALDLDVSHLSQAERLEVIRAASEAGFNGIGVYNNAIHVDIGGERAWGPNFSKTSIPAWAKPTIDQHLRGDFRAPSYATTPTVLRRGMPYETASLSEEPHYTAAGLARVEQVFKPDSLSISKEGLDFIKKQETFIPSPQLDALGNNWIVGYGHVIQEDDVIGGKRVTLDDLKTIGTNTNDFQKKFQITHEEADAYLNTEIEQIGDFLEANIPTELTQDQYDSTTSFIRNVGLENLESTPEGQEYLNALQSGDMKRAQELMTQFSHVGDEVNCDVLERRQSEIGRMQRGLPDVDYVPDGEIVEVGEFKMTGEVYNAIRNAEIEYDLPRGYLFAIAAQESTFNPNAKAPTSSAKGLFQFIDSTGAAYGLNGSNVFNPDANANAAGAFTRDNMNAIRGVISREPTGTDLYFAHFLGAGGAKSFLGKMEANPNGKPALDGFGKQAAANQWVFYNRNGTPKTYRQIYSDFDNKINGRMELFTPSETV